MYRITYHVFTVDTLNFLLSDPVIKSYLAREKLFTRLYIWFAEAKLLRVKGQSIVLIRRICGDWPDLKLLCLLWTLPHLVMLRVESKSVLTFCGRHIIVKHCGGLDGIGIFMHKVLRLSRVDLPRWRSKGVLSSLSFAMITNFNTHLVELIIGLTTCQNLSCSLFTDLNIIDLRSVERLCVILMIYQALTLYLVVFCLERIHDLVSRWWVDLEGKLILKDRVYIRLDQADICIALESVVVLLVLVQIIKWAISFERHSLETVSFRLSIHDVHNFL